MRRYTDTYHAARLTGARPIFLLFLGTNYGLRCFGKHTPTAEQVGDTYDVLEWSARVLTFGDLRQALSQNSERVIQGLFEEKISTYGAELDNSDGYFSEIAGRETFLNGEVILLQGYDYPGMVFADFQPLYYGSINTIDFDERTFKFTSIQAFRPQEPDDPPVETSKIYAMTLDGTGQMAAGSYTYDDLEEEFYEEESWTITVELTRETTLTEETIFRLENDTYGSTRLEIGIDATDSPYIKFTEDAGTASPTYTTLTADFSVGLGSSSLRYEWNDDDGQVIMSDGKGNSTIITLTGETLYAYESQFGSSGSGDGEFDGVRGLAWGTNSLYVADYTNQRIQRFLCNASGTISYLSQWAFDDEDDLTPNPVYPYGIGVDSSSGDVYVSNGREILQRYSQDGTFLSAYYKAAYFGQVTVDRYGNVWVPFLGFTDGILKFTSFPNTPTIYGSSGTGDGQFNEPRGIAVDTAGNIYVADTDNHRIQKFDSGFTFLTKWGSYGTGDGEFQFPTSLNWTIDNELIVADAWNKRFQMFDTAGNYIRTIGSSGTGDGQFSSVIGIVSTSSGALIAGDGTRLQVFLPYTNYSHFDMTSHSPSPTTEDEKPVVGDGMDGTIGTLSFSPGVGVEQTFSLINGTSATETAWEDQVSGKDLLVEDGTWEEWIINDTYTVTVEETPGSEAEATEDLPLNNTSVYSNPGENQANVILPLPYGNLRENSDGGVWNCPCIDSVNHVYCVAGWPIQSVANGNTIDVYVDGTLQSSGYTFDESNDYESQGNIAILDFSSDPGGAVTVKCNGKWVDGALLQSPVDIIEDFLTYAADLLEIDPWQTNSTSFAIARNVVDSAGYQCAGVMTSQNSIGFWIKAILKSFLGDFRFNADGELEIKLTPLTETQSVQEWLSSYEAITCRAKHVLENICGRIIINYANSLVKIDRRYKEGGETSYFRTADKSQAAINTQAWTLGFDWCRKTSNIELMQDMLLARYADPEYLVNYLGQDFKYVPLDLTDQIQATLPFLKDSNGDTVEDVVYSIREKTINLDDFTTTMTLQSVNFVDVAVPYNYVRYRGEYVTYHDESIIYNED